MMTVGSIDYLLSKGLKHVAIEAVGNTIKFEILQTKTWEDGETIGEQPISYLFPWSSTIQGDKFWRNIFMGRELYYSNEYLRGAYE